MTVRGSRYAVVLAGAVALGLAGCGTGSSEGPSAATTAAKSSAKPTGTATGNSTTKTSAKVTTSTLGAMPPVLSSAPTKVDAGSIGSLADVPKAFQCPSNVTPIELPATPTAPAGVVCPSRLAGDEALFLWYVGNPDERYLALQTALAKARYVHGGSNWVAGGMLNASMGDVGGDVYK